MLNLEINNLKKYFGDRLILDIDNLKVYSEDKIGIVGVNGAGKSTLLNILCENTEKDEGFIKHYGSYSYISQLGEPNYNVNDNELCSKFNLKNKTNDNLSGGEKTRFKIAEAFSKKSSILFADEPTSNLDISAVKMFEEMISKFSGAVMLVSHDRELLDKVCNKILEIENGKVKLYDGNYSSFIEQRKAERERKEFEYSEYIKEKERLEKAAIEIDSKSLSMRKAPKRMGNSEARLHRKMGNQKSKAKLDKTRKAIYSRIEHLEVKEKVVNVEKTNIDFEALNKVHSKVAVAGENINKAFGKRVIFNNAEFEIFSGTKVALMGDNGSGKTTLIKMILNSEEKIKLSKAIDIGYFSQDLSILDEHMTMLKNVMSTSVYNEDFARLTLSRLLFKREDVYKKVSVLSGGERVKLSFAKIILSGSNMLILDEPTNYLDLYSIEALEDVLTDYNGTILFVSHDRKFVKKVATDILTIKNHKISTFRGSYDEYLKFISKPKDINVDIKNKKMILENKLSEIIGRLSMPGKKDNIEELDKEYKELLDKISKLKNEYMN
ncbi:ribosomal protection-like ABC-F family protein [Clostridium hydrogenum]|uniref:ribosomal protection-like ABC-F family protein n=1 Tax=Clostridium hydrogenum TaxID=2855764 RepID=UPI001F41948D|nr:ABC-F type ribosomal protection protein [Clostridium hydrogenum]